MTNRYDNAAEAQDAESRRRIAEDLTTNLMIEAAAGTGKTTGIVRRMVHLVASGSCAIDRLAAVTFTRKAAAELRDRFQLELQRRATPPLTTSPSDTAVIERLRFACDHCHLAFVGTIHSFCASLLRERPVEFGVDPTFRELDDREERAIRNMAWQENIDDMLAANDPLINQLIDLDIDRTRLKSCFAAFVDYRDVEHWPHALPREFDLEGLQARTREYVADMVQLLPQFPVARGNDELMSRYEQIVRASYRDDATLAGFFNLLERFDRTGKVVQGQWPDKALAKRELSRWTEFRSTYVKPGLNYWYQLRYGYVIQFVRRALQVYQRMKSTSRGLDFSDLLLIVARGLRHQPELRRYFQRRYSHLLVDEFQDTDPVQAEVMLYLTSADVLESDWQQCTPRPGSLFVVGDPKQSIYRFRRGDMVTYNRVKEIFERSGGEVLALAKNFRSVDDLLGWNNRMFEEIFPAKATPYAPAAENMLVGRDDAIAGQLRGLFQLPVNEECKIEEATRQEADAIARFIRYAIDTGLRLPRTLRDRELGRTAAAPRDFMILTRNKNRIRLFKEALDRWQIPCEVTGDNAFLSIAELRVLIDCLRAVDDPFDPVATLAVLRDKLFGFSDRQLFQFKQAGGRFLFTVPLPTGLPEGLHRRFDAAFTRLKRYQAWLRSFPFASGVLRIAEDLGLLARAAAGGEGNVAVGSFLKAIEWLRQQSHDFDSATDLIAALEETQNEKSEMEGCAALASDANVVRVMNLHKAKGLEAPVVFLADTSRKINHTISCHIDRRGKQAAGAMAVSIEKGKWSKQDIARPEDWSALQSEEQKFLDAEQQRLLYVATTRAACALIVSVGKQESNWADLYPHVAHSSQLLVPSESEVRKAWRPMVKPPFPTALASGIADRWLSAAQPSYHIAAAKELGLRGGRRPRWETSGDYGLGWGLAVHALLERGAKLPKERLRHIAPILARQYGVAANQHAALVDTVESVMRSEVWRRSQSASHCFHELPIEIGEISLTGETTLIRGVIDLIFEEPEGWVIVDYKTDDIQPEDLTDAVNYYRGQLDVYSRHWQRSLDAKVAELGFYFTRIDRYVTISPTAEGAFADMGQS